MMLHVAPVRYIHERYFGRHACPKCGELMMASESSQYLGRCKVRHNWVCDGCDYQFLMHDRVLNKFVSVGACHWPRLEF